MTSYLNYNKLICIFTQEKKWIIRLDDTWYCLQAWVISASVLVRLLVRKGTCNIKHRLWNVRRLPEIFTPLFSISEYSHLFFSPRTKTQPIMKTLNFIAQCSLRNAMLSLTVLVVFWSLCKFCTELKNIRFYTVILFFFFYFFSKEIIIFEDIIKEKNVWCKLKERA